MRPLPLPLCHRLAALPRALSHLSATRPARAPAAVCMAALRPQQPQPKNYGAAAPRLQPPADLHAGPQLPFLVNLLRPSRPRGAAQRPQAVSLPPSGARPPDYASTPVLSQQALLAGNKHALRAFLAATVQAATVSPLRVAGVESPLRRLMGEHSQADYLLLPSGHRGAFGTLSYAIDRSHQICVVKELVTRHSPDAQWADVKLSSLASIGREIFVQQQLSARLRPHAVLRAAGHVYLFMPMLSGDLNDLLRRMTLAGLPPQDRRLVLRSAFCQLATLLHHYHTCGYIYSDLKLHNALWEHTGDVTLCDFGMTTPIEPQTGRATGRHGTPYLMAKEIVADGSYCPKAETWALFAAFCSAVAPLDRSPLLGAPTSTERYDRLSAWQQRQQFVAGRFVPKRYAEDSISRFFEHVNDADPQLCSFGLQRMFVDNPENRASMAEVKEFLLTLQPTDSLEQRRAVALCKQLSTPTTAREQAVASLHVACRQVYGVLETRSGSSANSFMTR
jgi:serine/threonine protein kinase